MTFRERQPRTSRCLRNRTWEIDRKAFSRGLLLRARPRGSRGGWRRCGGELSARSAWRLCAAFLWEICSSAVPLRFYRLNREVERLLAPAGCSAQSTSRSTDCRSVCCTASFAQVCGKKWKEKDYILRSLEVISLLDSGLASSEQGSAKRRILRY